MPNPLVLFVCGQFQPGAPLLDWPVTHPIGVEDRVVGWVTAAVGRAGGVRRSADRGWTRRFQAATGHAAASCAGPAGSRCGGVDRPTASIDGTAAASAVGVGLTGAWLLAALPTGRTGPAARAARGSAAGADASGLPVAGDACSVPGESPLSAHATAPPVTMAAPRPRAAASVRTEPIEVFSRL